MAPKSYKLLLSLLLTSAFLCSGCASVKTPSDTAKMWTPPRWEERGTKNDEVWAELRNKRLPAGKSFALPETITIALNNNPKLLQAFESAKASHALWKQAESKWYPQVSVEAAYVKDKKDAAAAASDSNTRGYGATMKAEGLALDFGGRAASVKEAYHAYIASNYDFNQTIQDVILETETAFFNLYSAKASLAAAEADVDDAKSAYFAAEKKFQVGVAAKLDTLQAKSNYDESLFNREDAKGNVKTSKADLAKVLGLPADIDFDILSPSYEIPENVKDQEVSALIEEALNNRNDVSASRSSLKEKISSVYASASDMWPSLTAGATGQKQWTETFGDDKSYTRFFEYTGYLKVNWDIFDGFNNYSKLRQAQAEARSEKYQLQQDEIDAAADVWTKFYAFKTAASKMIYGKALLDSSEESYTLALESYKSGLQSVLDVLQAYSQLSDARSKFIQSENDLFVAFAGLAHSTGSTGHEESSDKSK